MNFCSESFGLYEIEFLMRQAPGFIPRGYGLYMNGLEHRIPDRFEEGLYEHQISRLSAYYNIDRFKDILQYREGTIFRDADHKKRISGMLAGPFRHMLMMNRKYLTAVFLLAADGELWERAFYSLSPYGIHFREIRLGGLTTEQYLLYHLARDFYFRTKFVSREEIADPELVSDDLFSIIINAHVLAACGAELLKSKERCSEKVVK